MSEKILYIYGYGSNPRNSSTMKSLKGVITEKADSTRSASMPMSKRLS